MKVVGTFHGLSRDRSDARRYPAIDPLESWSKYTGIIPPEKVERARFLLQHGDEVRQMMTVVGEEGTTIQDYTLMLKSEFFDSSYLQQNAFDRIDGATMRERQQFVFDKILEVLNLDFEFEEKEEARSIMMKIGNLFRDWNYAPWDPSVMASREAEQSESKAQGRNSNNHNPDKSAQDNRRGDSVSDEDKIYVKNDAELQDRADVGGDFKKILAEIDDFIKGKGVTAASKGDGKAKQKPSSYLSQKAKSVTTGTRPRSRRTHSGRGSDEEETLSTQADSKH